MKVPKANGGVNRQELAGGTWCEGKSVVHGEPVSCPIPFITREFSELFGTIRGGGYGFEELVVGAAVVAADAEAKLGNVYSLGGVSRGLLDDLGARGRGGLRGHVKATR